MPFFDRDGIRFHYLDQGVGVPFVFQHGLGGDAIQTSSIFQAPRLDNSASPPIRLVTLECRGHGETRPLGPEDKVSIASYADDVIALMDHLSIERAVIGGISMGAAIALNIGVRYASRVTALILSRPAWVDRRLPSNLDVFLVIALLIRTHGAKEGLARFKESAVYKTCQAECPDVALTLCGQFEHPRAEETAIKLERIPRDAPCASRESIRAISARTLVLANKVDIVHPYEYGETLASTIPNAELRELTSKSIDINKHMSESRTFIEDFISSLEATTP